MAIPTTQKECTTRRIAALIIGLWDKVKNAFLLKTSLGAANGVASLDANGKVPSSQLPKIGTSGIADDAITAALVKDGETFPVNIRGYSSSLVSGSAGFYSVTGYVIVANIKAPPANATHKYHFLVIKSYSGTDYSVGYLYITGRLNNNVAEFSCTYIPISSDVLEIIALKCYFDSDSNSLKIYGNCTLARYCGIRIVLLSATEYTGNNISDSYYVLYNQQDILAAPTYTPITIIESKLMNSTYSSKIGSSSSHPQIGGSSTPVYVNGNGEIKACTGIPVIEHVTSIPPDPTVGTIYAL